MDLLTSSLVPILLNPTNILLYVIGNFFLLLVLFSVLFIYPILSNLTVPTTSQVSKRKRHYTIYKRPHLYYFFSSFIIYCEIRYVLKMQISIRHILFTNTVIQRKHQVMILSINRRNYPRIYH